MEISVQELYGEIWGRENADFEKLLETSLEPRSPDTLYDHFAALGIESTDIVLDVGCRRAEQAIELVEKFGCQVIGIDPIALHVEDAAKNVAKAKLQDRISVQLAGIEEIPLESASVHHIFCRDTFNHVDLAVGLSECQRVLIPEGSMLTFQFFASELMEPQEAKRIYNALSIRAENMSAIFFEQAVQKVGFEILDKDVVDSEWYEYAIEDEDDETAENLLYAARLRRRKEEFVQKFGESRYEVECANCVWDAYVLLGKLQPIAYVLRKPQVGAA